MGLDNLAFVPRFPVYRWEKTVEDLYALRGLAAHSHVDIRGVPRHWWPHALHRDRAHTSAVVVHRIQRRPGLPGDLLSVKGRQTTLGPGEQLTSWLPTRSLAWVYTQCGTGWRGRTIVEDQAGRRGGRLKTQILVPKILGAYLILAALYQIG